MREAVNIAIGERKSIAGWPCRSTASMIHGLTKYWAAIAAAWYPAVHPGRSPYNIFRSLKEVVCDEQAE